MSFTRRDVLRLGLGSVILSASSVAPSFCFAADGAKKIPLCLQMYSV